MRETMLILHFIGLTMGLGTGFAHAFLGTAISKMSPEEGTKFHLHTLVLARMGQVGIGLLLISGFYMITPYWKVIGNMPILMIKLGLVAILIVLVTLLGIAGKKAKQGDAERQFKKIAVLGKITLLVGIAIVVMAVMTFH